MTRWQHGGRRPGAGRKSPLGGRLLDRPYTVNLTTEGLDALSTLTKTHGLSRNAIIGALLIQHADALGDTPEIARGPVVRHPLAIRLPRQAAAKLVAAHIRTARSYADITESLLRVFTPGTVWPTPATRLSR